MPTIDMSSCDCCGGGGCCPETFASTACFSISAVSGCACLDGATGTLNKSGTASNPIYGELDGPYAINNCTGTGNPCTDLYVQVDFDTVACTALITLDCCTSAVVHTATATQSDMTCSTGTTFQSLTKNVTAAIVAGDGCCDGTVTFTLTSGSC